MGAIVLLLDQLTKIWIRNSLAVGETRPLIEGILHLTHVENTGAAFGLFPNHTWVFVVATIALFTVVFLYRHRLAQDGMVLRLGYALGLAGATGNFIDRILFGRVTDFVDFRVFPIFNVADSAITIGVLLLAWCMLMDSEPEQSTDLEPGEEPVSR